MSRRSTDRKDVSPGKFAVLMKFEGVPGKSDVTDHPDWIRMDSVQFGIGRGIGSSYDQQGNKTSEKRQVSEPSISEVVLTSHSMRNIPALFREALGKRFTQVIIRIVDLKNRSAVLEWVLHETLISGFSISAGADGPSHSLSLNFSRIRLGSPESKESVEYDLEKSTID